MARYGLNLGISPREPITRLAEIARSAEDYRFDAIWVTDTQLAMKDPYIALALAGQATRRIRLGPGVTNPITRHLTHIANTISAVDEASGGRALLGMGPGDTAVFSLGLRPATVAEMRTALLRLRALLHGEEVELETGVRVRVLSARPVPIFLAASQPRMLALAGETADGAIVMGGAHPDLTRWQLQWLEEGLRRAGRRREEFTVDLLVGLALDEDRQQARSAVRPWVVSQARWFHRWRQLPPVLEPYRPEFARAHESYEFLGHLSRHASHAGVVSDELVDLVAIAGPLDECVRRVRDLLALGVDRVTFTLPAGGRMERLRRLGEELLPALEGA